MKILITSDWYTPAVNGVVASVLNLKHGLEERGHDVRVLTLSPNVHSYAKDNVTYIGAVPAGAVYPGARVRYALAHPLVEDIMKWHPDIVHSNCEMSTFFIARKIAKHLGIPLVHTYHTVYEDYTHYFSPSKRVGKAMVRKFSRMVANRVSAIIVPTVKVKRLLEDYNVSAPLYVLPTGIDQNKFTGSEDEDWIAEKKKKLKVPDGNVVAIYIGRLAKEKNIGEIIHNMKDFAGRRVTLLIIGDGPYRRNLKAQAEVGSDASSTMESESASASSIIDHEDAANIIFAGAVKPEEVGRYYHLGDIFVSASNSETQGLTYFEALASGLPVLCKSDECLDDVVCQGVNGWQYDREEEFIEHLNEYIANEEGRKRMRKEALRTGERFSVAAFAENAEGIYDDAIEYYFKRPMKKRNSRVKTTARAVARKVKRNRGVRTARRVASKVRSIRLLP